MRKMACAVFGVLVLTSLAGAQIPTSGNIFVGYSYENTNWSGLSSGLGRPNLSGWEASLEGKVFPHVGIVTDFSGHYGSQSFTTFPPAGPGPVRVNVTGHEWELLFGPRLSIPIGKLTPFAEAMFGLAHVHNGGDFPSSANTSFATAIGGGIDYRLIKFFALRLQVDYLKTHFYDTRQNNLRLSPGLVFRF
jgi:opacity protein-like surface antigen